MAPQYGRGAVCFRGVAVPLPDALPVWPQALRRAGQTLLSEEDGGCSVVASFRSAQVLGRWEVSPHLQWKGGQLHSLPAHVGSTNEARAYHRSLTAQQTPTVCVWAVAEGALCKYRPMLEFISIPGEVKGRLKKKKKIRMINTCRSFSLDISHLVHLPITQGLWQLPPSVIATQFMRNLIFLMTSFIFLFKLKVYDFIVQYMGSGGLIVGEVHL